MSRHHAAGQLPPVGQRITDQIVRHVLDLRIPDLDDAAQYAAVRILADREIADGLAALPVIAVLDARHQPRPWQGSSTGYVCTAGCGAYPCIDRQILDGTTLAAAVAS